MEPLLELQAVGAQRAASLGASEYGQHRISALRLRLRLIRLALGPPDLGLSAQTHPSAGDPYSEVQPCVERTISLVSSWLTSCFN